MIIRLIAILLFLGALQSQSHAQDRYGFSKQKMYLVYIEKIEKDTVSTLPADSSIHYTGDQGGTTTYNPFEIDQTHLVYDGAGQFRVEFGGGVSAQQKGWLPFFANASAGYHTIIQSNSPECDCQTITTKILRQVDTHVRTDVGGSLQNGCIFTIFIYWVSPL